MHNKLLPHCQFIDSYMSRYVDVLYFVLVTKFPIIYCGMPNSIVGNNLPVTCSYITHRQFTNTYMFM